MEEKYRCCENCTPCAGDFKKVIELQYSGLTVYMHTKKDDQKKTVPTKSDGGIILHNTGNKELRTPDFVNELDRYKTRCNQCKSIIPRVQSLLDEIVSIRGNEVIGICEHCRIANTTRHCKKCEFIVSKFLASQENKDNEKQKLFKNWLMKVKNLLQAILNASNVCHHMTYKDTELERILRELKAPLSVRTPDIDIFPSLTDDQFMAQSITESKEMLEELLSRIHSEGLSKRLTSGDSLYPSPSDQKGPCICKLLKEGHFLGKEITALSTEKYSLSDTDSKLGSQVLFKDILQRLLDLKKGLNLETFKHIDKDLIQSLLDAINDAKKHGLVSDVIKKILEKLPEISGVLIRDDETTGIYKKMINDLISDLKNCITQGFSKELYHVLANVCKEVAVEVSKDSDKDALKSLSKGTTKKSTPVTSRQDISKPGRKDVEKILITDKNQSPMVQKLLELNKALAQGFTQSLNKDVVQGLSANLKKTIDPKKTPNSTKGIIEELSDVCKIAAKLPKNIKKEPVQDILKETNKVLQQDLSTEKNKLLLQTNLKELGKALNQITSKDTGKTPVSGASSKAATSGASSKAATSGDVTSASKDTSTAGKTKKKTQNAEDEGKVGMEAKKAKEKEEKDAKKLKEREEMEAKKAKEKEEKDAKKAREKEELAAMKSKEKEDLAAKKAKEKDEKEAKKAKEKEDLEAKKAKEKDEKDAITKEKKEKENFIPKDKKDTVTKEKMKAPSQGMFMKMDAPPDKDKTEKNDAKLKELEEKRLKALAGLSDLPQIEIRTRAPSDGSLHSFLECDVETGIPKYIVRGTAIEPYDPRYKEKLGTVEKLPALFKKELVIEDFKESKISIVPRPPPQSQKTKSDDGKDGSGIIRYRLSDREFIEKGWTKLPTKKIMRRMNIYKMQPACPEYDWFERHKDKRVLFYDSGEKLAQIDDDGRGRWYYRNGAMALEYYNAEEINAGQRYIVYSSGAEVENGRQKPRTVLALFDYLGNGVVYDYNGNVRLKYNQSEGILVDSKIGPPGRWKWHTLNDPPVLQQVFVNARLAAHDPDIEQLEPPTKKSDTDKDLLVKQAQAEMLQIELDNFVKEKSQKLMQKFKPFQIRMKVVKLNNHFSVRILDQSNISLMYRDGPTNLKLNLGMHLNSNEIIDSDISEVTDVSTPYDKRPAKTESVANIQHTLNKIRKINRKHREPRKLASFGNILSKIF